MSDALNLAAYNNQVGVIAYLLKKGVDVNFITDSDCAALHVAAYRGHIAAVKLLLANDADPLLLNDKKQFVQTNDAFFTNLIQHGFLLLNASLVLQESAPAKDAKAWQPFIHEVLNCLFEKNPTVTLILLGRIANTIDELVNHMEIERLYAEHPYNLSFITNPNVLQFFQPLHLLHHHK